MILLMEEIRLTTWDVQKKYVNTVMVYLSTGAGFLNHQTVLSRNRGEPLTSLVNEFCRLVGGDPATRWRSLQEDAAHPVSVSNFLGWFFWATDELIQAGWLKHVGAKLSLKMLVMNHNGKIVFFVGSNCHPFSSSRNKPIPIFKNPTSNL